MTQTSPTDTVSASRPSAASLDAKLPLKSAVSCKVCGGNALPFDVVDFNKYCSHEDFYSFGLSGITVPYHRCRMCGSMFTTFFDKWTSEDFARRIYNDDYIKVDSEYVEVRPRFVARDMAERWGDCRAARVLDYGSGAGVFADELRILGYQDVTAYDPFSSPERPTGTFDIITCFEVIEHTPSPLETFKDMCRYLKPDGCVIVSQTLQPDDIDRIRANWWYVGPRNGHICTYTADSMSLLAQSCGLTFHLGGGPYGFSRPQLSRFAKLALETMGKPHYFLPLLAPPGVAPIRRLLKLPWHKMEQGDAGPFRWTGSSTLTWDAPAMPHCPGTLRVALPVFDRITPDFLRDVQAEFGGQTVALKSEGVNLVGDFEVRSSASTLTIRTKRPITPRSLRGDDDDRRLGLAVLG